MPHRYASLPVHEPPVLKRNEVVRHIEQFHSLRSQTAENPMRDDSAVCLSKSQGGAVKTNVLNGICTSPGNAAAAEPFGKSAVNVPAVAAGAGMHRQTERARGESESFGTVMDRFHALNFGKVIPAANGAERITEGVALKGAQKLRKTCRRDRIVEPCQPARGFGASE